jgi:glycogen operon protein
MWLNGEQLPETDERGHPLHDASFLVLFNAHHDVIDFRLPDIAPGRWHTEIDTSYQTGTPNPTEGAPEGTYPLQGRSLVLLRQVPVAP